MNQRYAILNEIGGWLENLIIWDGNIESWRPPDGTVAKLASEVDFNSLPEKPNE